MAGSTSFEPQPERYLESRFTGGFLLWAWNGEGAWRPALRLDRFRVRQSGVAPTDLALDERGHALTADLAWRPHPRLRVSGEWLLVDSRRNQRVLEGLPVDDRALQFQLSVRILF